MFISSISLVSHSNSATDLQFNDLALYLYGDDPAGGDTYFLTDSPTGTGNFTTFPSSGGTFIAYELGFWNTQPLNKELEFNGPYSVSVWLENQEALPARVEVSCQLRINDQDAGITLSSQEVDLSDSTQEITFSDSVNLKMKKGDLFGIYLTASYQGTGFTFHWGDINYPSKITGFADWLGILIPHPVVDETTKMATIKAHLIHIFGPSELIGYTMEITGPTSAVSLIGPTIEEDEDIQIATWVWDYGDDGAYEGSEYSILITILDRSGNYWNQSREFYLTDSPVTGEHASWYLFDKTLSSNGEEFMPSMIIDSNGKFWMAYSSNRDFSWVDVYVESSLDGRTWNLEARITEDTAYDVFPCLIQDSSGTYWLAWQSDVGGDYQIWMSSSDNGTIWDTPYQAFVQPDQNMQPSLIQDGSGTYWMAWVNLNAQNQYDVFVSSSSNALIWSAPQQVSTASLESTPSLILDSEGIFRMVWFSESTGYDELWQGESVDGSTWTIDQITNDRRQYGYPCLIQNASGGYDITYTSDRSGKRKIYHMSSLDGTNWIYEYKIENYTTYWVTSLIQDANGTMWLAFPYQVPDSWDIWILSKNWTNSLPEVKIPNIPNGSSGDILIEFVLTDIEEDLVNITAEYSSNGRDFYSATLGVGGNGTTYLSSSREGTSHVFVWDSGVDLFGIDDDSVYFKITPTDEYHMGLADTSNPFSLDNNKAPVAEIESPASEQSDLVTITFTLYDEESDLIDIVPTFSINGVNFSSPTISPSSPPLADLASSAMGTTHSIIWDSELDIPDVDIDTVYFSITPYDPQNGIKVITDAFHVDNNVNPSISIDNLQGVQTDQIPIGYSLIDEESDDIRIEVFFSTDALIFNPATKGAGGDPISGLSSSKAGFEHEFIWDSEKDLRDKDEDTVYIKIIPFDMDSGDESQTTDFHVDNKAPYFDSQPEVTDITDSEATISWSSDESSRYRLYYGSDNNFDSEIANDVPRSTHSYTLENLKPGTKYSFYIELFDEIGNGPKTSSTISFTTLLLNNPPEIFIEYPSVNQEVSEEIIVGGTASDDNRLEDLEIRIDTGEWISIYVTEAWTYELDTKALSNGEHTLYVRAFDGELYSKIDSVDIIVNNEKEEPPDNTEPEDDVPEEKEEDNPSMIILLIVILTVIIAVIVILIFFKKK
jgi:hypothetical protein